MLMTSVLLFIAMREIWGWSCGGGALAGAFPVVDAGFLGGQPRQRSPMAAMCRCCSPRRLWRDVVWHLGARGAAACRDSVMPIDEFCAEVDERKSPRVPGTAVFMTRTRARRRR